MKLFGLKIFILLATILLSSCNISLPTNENQKNNYVCQTSPNSFASCCVGRGGALSCSPPFGAHYFRSSDGALICGDGSVSTVCYR
ncbi:hypothetical protein [Pseudobdellovibrio exovorus]|uniref:hypothetical protein n=1 Tax=Pseudobdellovibrio exovorus TaxID=453816 RepID=UPI0011D28539|nr:hypothetical protein [Pseudobdellovibrio exovorus]